MWTLEHTPNIFHDLSEILEFLVSLSPYYLYRWQEARIYYKGVAVMYILIYYNKGKYYISYKEIKNDK